MKSLFKVCFYKQKCCLVFANNIDEAKREARRVRPDCQWKNVVEVLRIGKVR